VGHEVTDKDIITPICLIWNWLNQWLRGDKACFTDLYILHEQHARCHVTVQQDYHIGNKIYVVIYDLTIFIQNQSYSEFKFSWLKWWVTTVWPERASAT